MDQQAIRALRTTLRLSQVEFAQLVGAHPMTVSKWERGVLEPKPFQVALLEQFSSSSAVQEPASLERLKALLAGAGAPAAIAWLLQSR